MFTPKFVITNRTNNNLAEIERARGFLEAAELKTEWLSRMQKRALILESHHSTHIEGTELTFEQAEKILSGEKVEGVDADDEMELFNYKQAIDYVSGYVKVEELVTGDIIRDIHKILVEGVRGGSADPGNYRTIIKVLEYLTDNDSITREQYVKMFDISLRTANYDISEIEKLNLIKRAGIGRATNYMLK